MTDKKELNNEQLEKVSGGTTYLESEKEYVEKYTKFVNKYETANYIGQNLYFSHDEQIKRPGYYEHYHTFIYGTLNRSYEASSTCGTTRTANVTVIASGGFKPQHGTVDLSLDRWHAYTEE